VNKLGEFLFTDYAFAFEITGLLLTIAVVGAVALSRKPTGEVEDDLPPVSSGNPVGSGNEVSA
jgi:hypothetical protein